MLVVDDEKESPATLEREESAGCARGWVAGDPRASTIIMPPLDPLEKCECPAPAFFLNQEPLNKAW